MNTNFPTVIMQTLSEACPDMDWSTGSVARELIAVPTAMLGAAFDQYVQDAERIFDITAIRENPEQYTEQIDQWLAWLGISTAREMQAAGSVKVYLSNLDSDLTIMEGTQFDTPYARLQATETTTWTTPERVTSIDTTVAQCFPDGTFAVEFPVISAVFDSVSVATGTALEWVSAPDNVTGAFVSSAINGGKREMSYRDKAELLYDTLQTASMSSSDGLQAALRREYPYLINSIKVGRRVSDTANNAVVYVKPVKGPQVIKRKIQPDSLNGTVYTISGNGIYSVDSVINKYKNIDNYTVTTKGSAGASDSKIVIETSDSIGEITVVCTGFTTFDEIYQILNEPQTLSPCKFTLNLPAVAYVSIEMHTDVDLTDSAKIAVQEYVNDLPLSVDLISDSAVSNVLKSFGIALTAPSFYTITVVHGAHTFTQTAIGSVSVAQLMADGDTPTACYSFIDNVREYDV